MIRPTSPDLIVVAATSMGQGPKGRRRHDGVEVTLVDSSKVPEGALAVRARDQTPADSREALSARDAKQFLLKLSGLGLG